MMLRLVLPDRSAGLVIQNAVGRHHDALPGERLLQGLDDGF
jgi:hypothetical protein